MRRFPLAIAILGQFVLLSLLRAQQPVDIAPADVDLWEHRLGPEAAIHLTTAEISAIRRFPGHDYLEFEIVVSSNGRVESAKLLGQTTLKSDEGQAIELARTFKPWLQNGNPIRARVHDYVQLLPPEQWADTRIPFPEITDLSTVSISLTRTICFGSCPDYTVTITGDGTVHYTGNRSVLITGNHIAHISQDAVRELLLQFRKADFFSAKHKYEGAWTDNPTQTITLTIGAHTKTVIDYVGLDDGLPLAIRNLEQQIDETANTRRWIKSDADTLPSLVEEKWPFGASNEQNIGLYSHAIQYKDSPLVEQYLAAHGPVVVPKSDQASPICIASEMGDLPLVERMMEHNKILSPRTLNQCLTTAARSGNLAVFQFWLDHGADPKAKPEKVEEDWLSDLGPLPNALIGGNVDIVRTLIDSKVDMPTDVREDEPIIIWAIQRNRGKQLPEIITVLARAGANVNARGNMGETPLIAALFNPELIKPLLAAGADLEARDDNGSTPLIHNAFSEPTVRELLANGADPTAVNKRGNTPLKIAHQYGCPACADLIQAALQQRSGNSPAKIPETR